MVNPVVSKDIQDQFREMICSAEKNMQSLDGCLTGYESESLCPLKHSFGDGIYTREMFMPAGALIISKIHKHRHPYFIMKGSALVSTDKGVVQVSAPYQGMTERGTKRAIYAIEDLVWTTVHSVSSKNLDDIEEEIIAKDFESFNAITYDDDKEHIDNSVIDYFEFLKENGCTENFARTISYNEEDMAELLGNHDIEVRDSKIQGKGLFALRDFLKDEVIAPARLGDKRTIAGRYTNHAINPNSRMMQNGHNIVLIANRNITKNEEFTTNYRDSLMLVRR